MGESYVVDDGCGDDVVDGDACDGDHCVLVFQRLVRCVGTKDEVHLVIHLVVATLQIIVGLYWAHPYVFGVVVVVGPQPLPSPLALPFSFALAAGSRVVVALVAPKVSHRKD